MKAQKCLVINCNNASVANGLCDKHRKRLERNGHLEQTRAKDWGSREKHSLYRAWNNLMRWNKAACVDRWRDFWNFVSDVGEKTEGQFKRRDEDQKYGPDNWYWKQPTRTREELAFASKRTSEWRSRRLAANPDYFKDKDLRKNYGVTLEWYRAKLDAQGHACAICARPEEQIIHGKKIGLSVDHCHEIGRARGLLCSKCNQGIGCLGHSFERVSNALRYLKEYGP